MWLESQPELAIFTFVKALIAERHRSASRAEGNICCNGEQTTAWRKPALIEGLRGICARVYDPRVLACVSADFCYCSLSPASRVRCSQPLFHNPGSIATTYRLSFHPRAISLFVFPAAPRRLQSRTRGNCEQGPHVKRILFLPCGYPESGAFPTSSARHANRS